MTHRTAEDWVPLKPAWLHILLALADGPQHGYGIRATAEARTDGHVKLWPVTLYGSLRDLEEGGLLRPANEDATTDEDARRRYYELTPMGRDVLRTEADRLQGIVDLARGSRALGGA